MVQYPSQMSCFEFVILSSLRATQLMRGCTPRVDAMDHKVITTAQLEVAAGKVLRVPASARLGPDAL